MKVNIAFETTDMEGSVSNTSQFAVMEKHANGYRLVYVEDVTGDGNKVKTTMHVSEDSLRVMRSGVIACDFMYGTAMVHHTSYQTPYGMFPVTLETRDYTYNEQRKSDSDFCITAESTYDLVFEGQEPMNMRIRIEITPIQ